MTIENTTAAMRMNDIRSFHVMKILERAKQLEAEGREVFHLEVGEPDFSTPQPIIEAGMRALQQGFTRYTPACGMPELREQIAAFYQSRFDVSIERQRVIVTPGASGALQLALGALLNPGDEVLMPDPAYPCNRHFVRLFEANAINIPATAENNYQLTIEDIRQYWTDKTKLVMLASPANPTGTILTKAELQAIHAEVQQRGGVLLIDEIYQGLLYEGEDTTALSVADDIWVINSFSKYFGMTGWRLGWLVVPESFIDTVDRLAQNIFLSASAPAQFAALSAFIDESLAIMEERRQAFKTRRDFLLPALENIGFKVASRPLGAFYIYADASQFTNDSQQLCLDLLENTGVAFTPGIDFGTHQANQHVRFAYTMGVERLAQAVEKIDQYLK